MTLTSENLALPFQDEAREVLHLSDLKIEIRCAWGTLGPDYRMAIRTSLYHWTCDHMSQDIESIKTPGVLFADRAPRFSIAHAKIAGGFVATTQASGIGLDIEHPQRVTEAIAARVSSPSFVKSAPSATHLWVALESAFKSFGSQLPADSHHAWPKTISEIKITHWEKKSATLWSFQFGFNHEIYWGIVFELPELICGIAMQ